MTQATPISLLSSHPAFAAISEGTREALNNACTLRAFSTGQELCKADLIPSEVLMISEGQARLLSRDQGRLCTVEKLGAGSVVGLASLLRAQPCEAVTASGPVQAWAIPDALVLELLVSEPGFAQWCSGHLFSAELLAVVERLLDMHPRQGVSAIHELERVRTAARLVQPKAEVLAQLHPDLVLLAASHNLPHHPVGARLDPAAGVPDANPPLPARLIGVPLDWYATITEPVAPRLEEPDATAPAAGSALVPAAGATPLASGLDLGQRDQMPFRLQRGEGPLEETLACFQMLAAELKLPFRRDAIEKILRLSLIHI